MKTTFIVAYVPIIFGARPTTPTPLPSVAALANFRSPPRSKFAKPSQPTIIQILSGMKTHPTHKPTNGLENCQKMRR